jgi:hypothetical protein
VVDSSVSASLHVHVKIYIIMEDWEGYLEAVYPDISCWRTFQSVIVE